jgi:hypothetical protein
MKARILLYTTFLVVMLLSTFTSVLAQSGEEWLSSPVDESNRCGADFGEVNPLGKQSFHNAVDMACGMGGDPVMAVASGKVVWADLWPIADGGLEIGHGRTVVIYHSETGLYTYYAHLSDISVSNNDEIQIGTVVGHVGNSGFVQKFDGNPNYHLHFAVRNTGPLDRYCWNESCWLNPDDYLGKVPQSISDSQSDSQPRNTENQDQEKPEQSENQSDQSSSPQSGEQSNQSSPQNQAKYYSPGLVGTIDEMADTIRYVPRLKKYSTFWDNNKKYLPWIVAILIVVLFLTVFKPIVDFLAKTKWGRRRNRKKAEFFWLSIILVIIYNSGSAVQELIVFLFNLTAGIWLFFTLTGLLNKLWRHFNYDPELEKILASGGVDGWEWLREIILTPVIYGIIVSILAFTLGFYWFRPKPIVAQAQEVPTSPSQESSPISPQETNSDEDDPNPSPPSSPEPSESKFEFSCDFDPIKAGLGPVKVGCDENGLPTFPIRWWNGNYFDFHIPPDIWDTVNATGGSLEQKIGIIAFGASESTQFTNYQSENYAGAAGTYQFLGETFERWAPEGFKDPSNRVNNAVTAKAVMNMQEEGMRQIYNMTNQAEFESCFQGGSGCNTWNQHSGQANFVWRLTVALRVAAGLD